MRLQKILRTASYAAPRSITPLRTITGNHPNRRCYHRAIAKFLTRNPNGELSTTEIPIKIGDPEEAYIMIPPAIGLAFQAGSLTDNFAVPTGIADRHKLTFFHDTRHFGCATSSSLPQLCISRDLPRQTDSNRSPATLYLYGKLHMIALDGTPDSKFAEDASTCGPDLGVVLRLLRDM